MQVSGGIDAQGQVELATTAVEHGELHDISRFLVDVRDATNIASTTEQYQYARRQLVELGVGRTSRIAVLIDPNDPSHGFIETVLRNAGYNCTLFVDEAFALAWLADE